MTESTKAGYYTNLSYAPGTVHATAWQVVDRPQSGTFIQTLGGVPLCKVGNGGIYLYDKKAKRDVFISIDALARLAE